MAKPRFHHCAKGLCGFWTACADISCVLFWKWKNKSYHFSCFCIVFFCSAVFYFVPFITLPSYSACLSWGEKEEWYCAKENSCLPQCEYVIAATDFTVLRATNCATPPGITLWTKKAWGMRTWLCVLLFYSLNRLTNWTGGYFITKGRCSDTFPIHFHAIKSSSSQTDTCEGWEWASFYLGCQLTEK